MGKVLCKQCEHRYYASQLKKCVETETEEDGVYVVHLYRCPKCGAEIHDKRLTIPSAYKAPDNNEPLRWET